MSEANLEIARRVLDAFGRREVVAVLELLDPKVVFFAPTAIAAHHPTTYRGHEGVRLYFDHVARIWEDLEVEPHDFKGRGEFVVALGKVRGRMKDANETVEDDVAWAWKVKDGKVIWGRVYTNPADALADAGLEA
jgi:ketosteroid isomerase-like protein